MWKDNLVFYKSKSYFHFCTSIGVHKKPSSLVLTYLFQVNFNCQDQFRPLIAGQIILFKQVYTHVYSIEVRYQSLMSIVNPLYARLYWPFQASASFVDLFLLFMFHVNLCYAVLPVPCGRLLRGAGLLALLCVVFSCVFV